MRFTSVLLVLIAAVTASPLALPQAVTQAISPSGSPPPGCSGSRSGSFGIAVMRIPTSTSAKRGTNNNDPASVVVSTGSYTTNGLSTAPTAMVIGHVSQIGDGQVQGGMHTVTMMPVSQIGDGQIQNGVITYMPAANAASTTANPATGKQSSLTTTPSLKASHSSTTTATTTAIPFPPSTSSSPAFANSGIALVACRTNSTLQITLSNGILTDEVGRTGYIASNYQFQFDKPPQSGAIYTAGWSICANGSLALGGSNVFYQCLSGDFYNLYNQNWAAQCSPVTINALTLVAC